MGNMNVHERDGRPRQLDDIPPTVSASGRLARRLPHLLRGLMGVQLANLSPQSTAALVVGVATDAPDGETSLILPNSRLANILSLARLQRSRNIAACASVSDVAQLQAHHEFDRELGKSRVGAPVNRAP